MSKYLTLEKRNLTRRLDTAGIVALVGSAVTLVGPALLQVFEYEAAVWASFAFSFCAALALFLVSRVIDVAFYTRDAEAIIRRSKADRTDSGDPPVAPVRLERVSLSPAATSHNTATAPAADEQRTAA